MSCLAFGARNEISAFECLKTVLIPFLTQEMKLNESKYHHHQFIVKAKGKGQVELSINTRVCDLNQTNKQNRKTMGTKKQP